MTKDEPTKDEIEALDTVLSFYSSELTSHASVLIASLIAFLTLIQIRLSLKAPSDLAVGTLFLLMFGIVAIGLYSVIRLLTYGGLSSTIIHGYVDEFMDFNKLPSQTVKERLPHAKVNEYALFTFRRRQTFVSTFYSLRNLRTWVIIPISLGISYLLLYLVLSG